MNTPSIVGGTIGGAVVLLCAMYAVQTKLCTPAKVQ
jgi:hypothetical protein